MIGRKKTKAAAEFTEKIQRPHRDFVRLPSPSRTTASTQQIPPRNQCPTKKPCGNFVALDIRLRGMM